MSILKIARMGNPVLARQGKTVTADDIRSASMQQLVDNMLITMEEYDGVGLAAPQVHESLQLFVAHIPQADETGNGVVTKEWVVFNPRITPQGQARIGMWEGCLSIPDIMGYVLRPATIELEYLDREGHEVTTTLADFSAIVCQHEADHLNGVLYIQRADLKRLAFTKEYNRYHRELSPQ